MTWTATQTLQQDTTHSNVCLVTYKYGLVQSDVVYSLTTKWRQSTCNRILRLHGLVISRHPFKLIFSFIYTVLGGSVHQEPSVFFNIEVFWWCASQSSSS